MSHSGKTYPVPFRRDFSINVDRYDDGWANRYIVDLLILPPGPGNGLQGTTWDCGPATYNGLNSLNWTSDPEIIAGFVWIVQMRCTIINGKEFSKECMIFVAPTTLALHLIVINDPTPEGPVFPFRQTWATVFRNPLFFTADGFSNDIEAGTKLWIDGPPH